MTGKTEVLPAETGPVTFCPPQNHSGKAWDRIQNSRSERLVTVLAIARPFSLSVSYCNYEALHLR